MSLIFAKEMVRTTLGMMRSIYCTEQYAIKAGYFHRQKVPRFDDTPNTEEWQREVYQFAAHRVQDNGYGKVVDVGCGSAYKLLKYLGSYDTIGIEVEKTLAHLRDKYPDRAWMSISEEEIFTLQPDLVICADVIEHVEDPNKFVIVLKRIAAGSDIIISTPERDLKRGKWHYGPSPNPYHAREWNQAELRKFLERHFKVVEKTISNEKQGTQMVLCK
ncbi:MAG: methyltransferase domain-containing protein [Saprospiraceae bacterium]|nr:methyltransferase domain-containing protein [Saprospiraceae bacterium]